MVKRQVIGTILVLANAAWMIALLLYTAGSPLVRSADDSLRSSLARGGIRMIIEQQQSKNIRVAIDDLSSKEWGYNIEAASYPVQPDGTIIRVSIAITESDWQRLDALRQQWCRQLPAAQRAGRDAADYVIGIRCSSGLDVRLIYLARADVPPEIIAVIERMDQALTAQGFPLP